MKEIRYIKGNALYPVGKGHKFIVHICNNKGGWGSGFVIGVSDRWKSPETQYRNWYARRKDLSKIADPFKLGAIQSVSVDSDLHVINMIAQDNHSTATGNYNRRYVDYDALEKCLEQVRYVLSCYDNASVHMPRIGCGLGGGKWEEVEPIILKTLSQHNIEVTVYDF